MIGFALPLRGIQISVLTDILYFRRYMRSLVRPTAMQFWALHDVVNRRIIAMHINYQRAPPIPALLMLKGQVRALYVNTGAQRFR